VTRVDQGSAPSFFDNARERADGYTEIKNIALQELRSKPMKASV